MDRGKKEIILDDEFFRTITFRLGRSTNLLLDSMSRNLGTTKSGLIISMVRRYLSEKDEVKESILSREDGSSLYAVVGLRIPESLLMSLSKALPQGYPYTVAIRKIVEYYSNDGKTGA
ncbi:hypothetical protein [Metallosphaera yellowstonensis]|uniref:hypothetical protein n=1 Tax=Metallosphaera yellowstonensis TaxID=1111107 RepID=UPI00064EBC16|nr:hypothetical protein [Metallosphaera yellowstonensis]